MKKLLIRSGIREARISKWDLGVEKKPLDRRFLRSNEQIAVRSGNVQAGLGK
jgi:hypothetical protein